VIPTGGIITPGSWLGLLGGGQLGRMFTMAAQSMGYRVCVLDPGDHSPAGTVADRHLRAGYTDPQALQSLAALCTGVTTEFENVPANALKFLADKCRVTPDAEAVAVAQDRMREKAFIRRCGLATSPYIEVHSAQDLAAAPAELFPGILKVARLGYDGKGQQRVASRADAGEAFAAMRGVPCVLEKLLDLEREISVVVARRDDAQVATFPVAENEHANGILDTSIVPARISDHIAGEARSATLRIAHELDYVGVLCVEYFIVEGGRLLVNEIAPRPHNSGHYTINACITSQFEQQARILAGMPLGAVDQHTPAVMVNILGEAWDRRPPDWERLLGHPGVKLHLYGKSEARQGRKMGHVTCLAGTLEEALALARSVREELGAGRGQ
jgi:5-(carboxyamino)imidazole ribonucleotide synthase